MSEGNRRRSRSRVNAALGDAKRKSFSCDDLDSTCKLTFRLLAVNFHLVF